MAKKRLTVADAQRRGAIIARTGNLSIANSTLSVEMVKWVKEQLVEGVWSRREIGQAVGVNTESISKIARGDTWGHVPWPEGVAPKVLVAPNFTGEWTGEVLEAPAFNDEIAAAAKRSEAKLLAMLPEEFKPAVVEGVGMRKGVDLKAEAEARDKLLKSLGMGKPVDDQYEAPESLDDMPGVGDD